MEAAGATPQGTRRFEQRAVTARSLAPQHFRATPQGLRLSSLGLGTYLGAPDGPTDLAVEEAVAVCLASARINVLDTAINYRHQRAERSVGRALVRSIRSGAVRRDEVLLATKVGYLAPDGEAGISPEAWLERELLGPGVLRREEVAGGGHAISPAYLRDQLRRSLENLAVETIDLLYLHNAPEAQLPAVGLETFLRRLEEAFATLESFRDQGRIAFYGLATWDSLRVPPGAPGHFPLEAAVERARRVGGEAHGLRFVQFPFNLAMPEAWTLATQPVGGQLRTLFRAAAELGVGCLTSVPLLQGRLARSGPRHDGLSRSQTALQWARSAPGTISALVGQKRVEHLSENLELAARPPWDEATFSRLLG